MNTKIRIDASLKIYYYDSRNDSGPTIPFMSLDNDLLHIYNYFKSRDILNVNGQASFVEPHFLTIEDKLNNLDSLNRIAYIMTKYMKAWYFDLDMNSKVLYEARRVADTNVYITDNNVYTVGFIVTLPYSRNVRNLITKGKFQHIFQVAKNIYEKIIDYNIPTELRSKVIDEVIKENRKGREIKEIFRSKYSKEEAESKSGLVDSSIDKSIIPDTGFKPGNIIVLYSYSSDKSNQE